MCRLHACKTMDAAPHLADQSALFLLQLCHVAFAIGNAARLSRQENASVCIFCVFVLSCSWFFQHRFTIQFGIRRGSSKKLRTSRSGCCLLLLLGVKNFAVAGGSVFNVFSVCQFCLIVTVCCHLYTHANADATRLIVLGLASFAPRSASVCGHSCFFFLGLKDSHQMFVLD